MKPASGAARVSLALWAGLVCLAAATFAEAATRWYHVEVVIFAQGGESPWSRDDWREKGPAELAKNTVELLPGLDPADRPGGAGRRHAFRTLPAASLNLGATASRLDRSNDYRVLMHVGWHQPGFSRNDAPGVHLGTLRSLAAPGRSGGASGEEVEGTVRLWRRRFLHVEVDLAFGDIAAWRERAHASAAGTPGVAENEPENESAKESARSGAGHAEPLRVVRLARSLRLQAGRLHYIDHPLFGILLRVRRLP